jgi:hypothetical protein
MARTVSGERVATAEGATCGESKTATGSVFGRFLMWKGEPYRTEKSDA